mgnify:FL=1
MPENDMFVLIAIIGEKDLWFSGFKDAAECEAHAALSNFDWWACVPIL